ncbi:MAG: TatD family hydrolase [Bacteroidales bacterium]|jgi:TatD DNase family protein|nr:TatD family hydrolase [Bacteroidales bacterium]
MIDTHTHLYDEQFDADRETVINRAIDEGVGYMLLPNVDLQTVRPMFDLCRRFPANCFSMVGIHPTSIGPDFEQDIDKMSGYLDDESVVAVGEIGIDLYWDKQYAAQQAEAFRIQVGWAKKRNLPLSIHCRKSYNEIISILKKEQDGSLNGVFHCFPGNERQADEVVDLGFSLGIGGVVTYKNAGMAKVVQHVDIDHILTETDAPYLPPVPYRGKRNESAYISGIVKMIAQLKNMSFEEVAAATHRNAASIFPGINR